MTNERLGCCYRWIGDSNGDDPPSLPTLITVLRGVGWLPDGASWWFGWCELEIALPGRLSTTSHIPEDWDVVHLFSAQSELRWMRRGERYQAVLLTETVLPTALTGWQLINSDAPYSARTTQRILWGNRLRLPDGEGRGIVQFPRRLDYDLAGETEKRDQTVMADVWAYYDAEERLQLVRYAGLSHKRTALLVEKEKTS